MCGEGYSVTRFGVFRCQCMVNALHDSFWIECKWRSITFFFKARRHCLVVRLMWAADRIDKTLKGFFRVIAEAAADWARLYQAHLNARAMQFQT